MRPLAAADEAGDRGRPGDRRRRRDRPPGGRLHRLPRRRGRRERGAARAATSRPPCSPASAASARATAATSGRDDRRPRSGLARAARAPGLRTADTDQGAVDGDSGADRGRRADAAHARPSGPRSPPTATATAAPTPTTSSTPPVTTAEALCAWGTSPRPVRPARRRRRGPARRGPAVDRRPRRGPSLRPHRRARHGHGARSTPAVVLGDGSPQFDAGDTSSPPATCRG